MRRREALGLVAWATLLATGCAGRSEPTRWYELRTEPPVDSAALAAAMAERGEVWEVSRRIRLPGTLDRDTLQRASGRASLDTLTGHRWAAPLRDSVPRLLLHDLALLRGAARVWPAPAPAGVAVTRRLQVEVHRLQAAAGARALQLEASWWLEAVGAPPGGPAPQPQRVDLAVPLADDGIDTLAAAHRVALWQLAVRIAADG